MTQKSQGADPRQADGYGPTLTTVVATRGPLPVHSVLTLAAGLAQALSSAHAAGVIHGDLNPARVLLAADGPRLTDFGIWRAVDLGQGRIGMPDFMAPEQAAGHRAGPASDIFSLGAVLLYAATGTWMSHFAWHLDQLPGELRPFIERCMAADPARRPTAARLCTELTAAGPSAAGHVAWPQPGIPARGTAPSGGWPAQAWTPAPPGTLAQAPSGARPPAAPFPAQTMTFGARQRVSRPAALTRRHAGLIAIAALACAVAIAGTVYVIHPWPYPVLRPTGLTADQRGTSSISLGWSNPASGPLPDKYVILRNGAVAATVPGNVDHFRDGGLAPATTYDFRVVAYRGGARSQPSPDLRAATRTPPLSAAVLSSSFNITEKLESGGSTVTGDTDGDTWYDTWTFASNCAVGPCAAQLSGAIDGEPFSAVLKETSDDTYTGTVPINDYYYCGSSETNYSNSTLEIAVKPAAASISGTQWDATKLSGSVTWEVFANPDGNCGSGTLEMSITG